MSRHAEDWESLLDEIRGMMVLGGCSLKEKKMIPSIVELAAQISDDKISDMKIDAAIVGDDEVVAVCERALSGSYDDRLECARWVQVAMMER
jgi:hypothetical protein